MRWPIVVLGAALCLVGGVWVGQGVGVIGGSFMSGQGVWAVIGAIAFVAGVAVIRRGGRRGPT